MFGQLNNASAAKTRKYECEYNVEITQDDVTAEDACYAKG